VNDFPPQTGNIPRRRNPHMGNKKPYRDILFCLLAAAAAVVTGVRTRAETARNDRFNVVYFDEAPYISLVELAERYKVKVSFDPRRLGMTFERGGSRLTLFHRSPTAVLDGSPRNMTLPARMLRGSMYAPAEGVVPLFSELVPGSLSWNGERRTVEVTGNTTTIKKITSENYSNGTLISILLSEPLEYTVELKPDGWLTIRFREGSLPPGDIFSGVETELVEDTRGFEDGDGAELGFLLSDRVRDYSLDSGEKSLEVLLSLYKKGGTAPVTHLDIPTGDYLFDPDIDLRLGKIDTVIIDPGHGGKDPGAIGPKKTMEKDIVLKVALELKKIIDKRGEIKAVLTRDRDVFVPLYERARIARENNGKLFISLHANSSRNRRARGIEIYFLSVAKTKEAEEVARRENRAIELEDDPERYASMSGLYDRAKEMNDILREMESSVYLNESQYMCSILLDKACSSTKLKRRGIKQAGFYVMGGTHAFMPSVLIEIGFISNPQEEKMLRRATYQKKLAQSIYDAIILFKKRVEKDLFTGS